MIKINVKVLKQCDIILSTSPAKVSKAIRTLTKSDISHAMLYVGTTSIIDSTGDGVQAQNPQRMFYEDKTPIYVLRHNFPLSDDENRKIVSFARSKVGTQYSLLDDDKQFCSRLVSQAYAFAGIHLVANPDVCTPEDLKSCSLLSIISDTTSIATKEELEYWENSPNIPRKMAEAQNKLLSGMRHINKRIQTIGQITQYLIEHPADDHAATIILKESGYLNVWEINHRKCPWQYDIELLNQFKSAEERDNINNYCTQTLEQDFATHHFVTDLEKYKHYYKVNKLQYIKELIDLYEILVQDLTRRRTVAQMWLDLHP